MYFEEKDIPKLISKETKVSKEKVEFIINNFWNTLRYYLTETKENILLTNFLKFTNVKEKSRTI